MQIFAKDLAAFSSAAAWQGPKIRSPSDLKASTIPAAKAAPQGRRPSSPTLFSWAKRIKRRKVVGCDGHVFAFDVGARVARRDENAVRAGALGDFPGQGVFTATAADDEDVHFHDSQGLRATILAPATARAKGAVFGAVRPFS